MTKGIAPKTTPTTSKPLMIKSPRQFEEVRKHRLREECKIDVLARPSPCRQGKSSQKGLHRLQGVQPHLNAGDASFF